MTTVNKNHYFKLVEDPENHYTFYPIRNRKYYDHYKKQVATFWTVEEVDLAKDRSDYEDKLTDNERDFVKNVLAFFAASDGIVLENLGTRFLSEVQLPEARAAYGFQLMMENRV